MVDSDTSLPYTCDIVLKGGLTSGIVYPPALVEIARDHRFRSVGGSSAGAIAAVAAAAAEVGRDSATGGFVRLARIPDELAETSGGATRLQRLFTPSASTADLFDIFWSARSLRGRALALKLLTATRSHSTLRTPLALLSASLTLVGLGGLVAAVVVGGAVTVALGLVLLVVLLGIAAVTWCAGNAASGALDLASSAPDAIRDNSFGLVSGVRSAASDPPGLTEWLHTTVQGLAGRDDPGLTDDERRRPVTYGELAAHDVRLVTMTTNITQGTSLSFPLTTGGWAFDPHELRLVLPEDVVQHLVDHAAPVADPRRAAALEAGGLVALPAEADLPVLLGARISLSFPLLISAIPLHTWAPASRRVNGGWEMSYARCWLSDGGITSNLPVHLFDRPVPTHPTYAINLADGGEVDQPPEANLHRPRNAGQGRALPVSPIESPASFLGTVLSTMQNWTDNALIRTVGQRERVCTVRLTPDQGGMNLDMPPETIRALTLLGAAAGRDLASIQREAAPELVDRGWPVGHQWEAQRFTRLRAFYSALGHHLRDARTAMSAPGLMPSYDQLSATAGEREWLPYSDNWTPTAAGRAAGFLADVDDATLDTFTATPPAGARLTVSALDRPETDD